MGDTKPAGLQVGLHCNPFSFLGVSRLHMDMRPAQHECYCPPGASQRHMAEPFVIVLAFPPILAAPCYIVPCSQGYQLADVCCWLCGSCTDHRTGHCTAGRSW